MHLLFLLGITQSNGYGSHQNLETLLSRAVL